MDAIKRDFFRLPKVEARKPCQPWAFVAFVAQNFTVCCFFFGGNDSKIDTVYGKNPAPPGMYKTL